MNIPNMYHKNAENTSLDNYVFLTIVIPTFNEAPNISKLLERINKNINIESTEIIMIDDGSTDNTLNVIKDLIKKYQNLKFISFSRNYGHQYALRAGLDFSSGEIVICMDADLQHSPELIEKLINKWKEGYKIVLTKRLEQKSLSFFKKLSSRIYYYILNKLGDIKIEPGSADFRLMDRAVVDILNKHEEVDLFYRGIIPTLGFSCTYIAYNPDERFAGKSNYSIRKMLNLALNGIISTSTKPLRVATYLSTLIVSVTFIYITYVLYIYFITETAIAGWSSVIIVLAILGAAQLFVLGIIGEYLAQTLKEIRNRPPYIINETNILKKRL